MLDYSRRGKSTDNAFIESFNGGFRKECLNIRWLKSPKCAKENTDAWR